MFSLCKLLDIASGGVVFATIQKFFPDEKGDKHSLLSDRRYIDVYDDLQSKEDKATVPIYYKARLA